MKNLKTIIGTGVLALLVSCGGGETKKTETPVAKTVEVVETSTGANPAIDAALMAKGESVYAQCLACHQPNGEGLTGAFPPLAKSDYMLEDVNRTIKTILYGTSEPITVNATTYPGSTMTKFDGLSDEDVAAVATYVLNSWGNTGGVVTTEMVTLNR